MSNEKMICKILYIGIVAERGRCYKRIWNIGYKRTLKIHINSLLEVSKLLNDTSNSRLVLEEFLCTCYKNKEIGKFYNAYNFKYIESVKNESYSYQKVNELIYVLLLEVANQLNKFIVNKMKVYMLLNMLHNLPKVYFAEIKDDSDEFKKMSIEVKDAIDYLMCNISPDMEKIIKHYLSD